MNRIVDYPEAFSINDGDYVLVDNSENGASCIKAGQLDVTLKNFTINEASGSIATFDDGENLPLAFLGVAIEPIQEGSGDPSPSNIRPISGWSEANVYDDPVYGGTIEWNQLSPLDNDSWNTNGLTATAVNGKITMSGTINASSGFAIYPARIYNAQKLIKEHKYFLFLSGAHNFSSFNFIIYGSTTQNVGVGNQLSSIIFRCTVENCTDSELVAVSTAGTEITATIQTYLIDLTQVFGETKANEIYAMEQAEAGSGVAYVSNLFPHTYYAYNTGTKTCVSAVNGDPYTKTTISWEDEVGTVYGGTLDVVSGVLTVDRVILDLGTLNWDKDSQNRWFGVASPSIVLPNLKPISSNDVIANLMCSQYKATSRNLITSAEGVCQNVGGSILINDTYALANYDTAQFKTYLNGVQLVYELATPIEIQLSPTQVNSLVGVNNIWADCGDVVVCYRKLWTPPEF